MLKSHKAKRVLVTGANGFLGANVVRQLSSVGYVVKAMVRKNSNILSLKGADYELFEGEITNEVDVWQAVSDCDYVIHCAARTAQNPSYLDAYVDANINATKKIIEACKQFKTIRFIFVSTANCFTNGSIENPGNEESDFMPWLKASGYAYSKYLAHKEVLSNFEKHSFPAIVVCPTFMIGAYDAKPSSGALLLYAQTKKVIFYPQGGKSFVNVEFVASAICQALTRGRLGESYLLAGENMTYKGFFDAVNRQSGKRKLYIPLPFTPLLILGKISMFIAHYFSFSLPLNTVNAQMLSLDNYFSNKKAVTELGLKETKIEEAVSNALGWFKQNRYLKHES